MGRTPPRTTKSKDGSQHCGWGNLRKADTFEGSVIPDSDRPTEKIRLETKYGKRRAVLGTELMRVKVVLVARWTSRATRGTQIRTTVVEREGSSIEYAGVEGVGYWGKILLVMTAVAKNVIVATIDRTDSLETPQSICPLVQPEPSCEESLVSSVFSASKETQYGWIAHPTS